MATEFINPRHYIVRDGSDDLGEVERMLGVAARVDSRGDRELVSFSITFDQAAVYGQRRQPMQTISLYRDKGIRASVLWGHLQDAPSLRGLLRGLVGDRGDVSSLGAIVSVEMLVTPAAVRQQ